MRKIVVSNNLLLEQVADIVAEGSSVTILAKGSSMHPFIRGGRDSVELSRVEGDIFVGDILLACIDNPTRYVVHRVVELSGDVVTLMGDGNILGCEKCKRSSVVARVTAIITPKRSINPYSGSWILYSKLWRLLRPLRRYILAVLRRTIF